RRMVPCRLFRGALVALDVAPRDCALQGALGAASSDRCRVGRGNRPRYRTPGTILRLLYRRRTGLKRYASPCFGYRRITARSSTSLTTTASPSKRLPKSLASARRP